MSCKPTFLLKPSAYKANNLYAILPDNGDGDMNVSSYIGNGTRVNSEGLIEAVATDTPRLDYHNGIGLLLEPTRTNLVFNSEALSGANWTHTNTQTANDTISPDGDKTGSKIQDSSNADSQYSRFLMNASQTDGTVLTFSAFVKFGNTDSIRVQVSAFTVADNYEVDINDDLTTTAVSDDFGGTVTKVEDYGDGWARVITTLTISGTTQVRYIFYPSYSTSGANTGHCWLWGAQIEVGAFATSYIPTTSSQLQRLFDSLNVGSVVTNGLINETSGALYVDLEVTDDDQDAGTTIARIGTTNGYVAVYGKTTGSGYGRISLQNTDTTTVTYTATTTKRLKALFNLFGDSTEVWVNGTKVITEASDLELTDEILLLRGQGGAAKIKEVAMYKRVLNDTDSKSRTQ